MWEEESWHRMTDTIWGVGYKLRTGVPRGRIVAELMSAGATEEQANGFIDYVIDVSTRQENTARQQSAQGWGRDVGYGVTLWVAGGLFTLGSYLLAKWWGTYWIATGAFVVGGFYILRGLYGLCKELISLRIRQENAPRQEAAQGWAGSWWDVIEALWPLHRAKKRAKKKPGSQETTCPVCNGTGEVSRMQESVFGRFVHIAPCERCHGEGVVPTNTLP